MILPPEPFREPSGTSFFLKQELVADTLALALCQTTSFLQNRTPWGAILCLYHDWWEHDGLHFHNRRIDFPETFRMIRTPRDLLQSMPGDDDVFIGITPADFCWYLRFYLHWNDEGDHLLGRFDVTLPHTMAEFYFSEVVVPLGLEVEREEASVYFATIRL